MSDILYIVMPAYNEEEIIEDVVKDWYKVLHDSSISFESRLCVVDDGSKDSTGEILDRLCKEYHQLMVIHKENGGHGSAVMEGYRVSLHEGADFVFQTDSDGQTSPDEFYEFWKQRNRLDAIFGNRINRNDGFIRKCIEKFICLLLRLYFDVRIPDSNAPFRLYSARTLRENMDVIPEACETPNIFFTVAFAYRLYWIKFLPVSFGKRETGKNSINIRRILRIGKHTISQFSYVKKALKRSRVYTWVEDSTDNTKNA